MKSTAILYLIVNLMSLVSCKTVSTSKSNDINLSVGSRPLRNVKLGTDLGVSWDVSSTVKKYLIQGGLVRVDEVDRNKPYCEIKFDVLGPSSLNGRRSIARIIGVEVSSIIEKGELTMDVRTEISIGMEGLEYGKITCHRQSSSFDEITIRQFEDVMGDLVVMGEATFTEGPQFVDAPGLEFEPANLFRPEMVFESGALINGQIKTEDSTVDMHQWMFVEGKQSKSDNLLQPHCNLFQASKWGKIAKGTRYQATSVSYNCMLNSYFDNCSTIIDLKSLDSKLGARLYCSIAGTQPMNYKQFTVVAGNLFKFISLLSTN